MKPKKFVAQLMRVLILVFIFSLMKPCFASLPPALKIWPLGDSITYGSFGTNGGYRGLLFYFLTNSANTFVFVGSSTANGGITILPVNQRTNEGHESFACNNILTNLDGFDNSLFLQYGGASRDPNGGRWLTGTNSRPALFPDVILLLIGANERDNTSGAQGRLDNLVSKLVTMRPTAHLIIARITPITDSISHSNFVVTYNQGVDTVVAKYAVSNRVTKVDLFNGFPTNGFSTDKLHPNDIGYTWMAGNWYSAIFAAYGAQLTAGSGSYSNNMFRIGGNGGPSNILTIQATTNFLQWTNIGTATGDVNGNFNFTDINTSSLPRRFYRTKN